MMKTPSHILITGASSGIGQALAEQYAGSGITLSLSGRDASRLEEVVQICRAHGAQVYDAVLDVTDQGAMERWMLGCDEKTPVDLVIANAGTSAGTGGAQGETDEQVRHLFDVNITGVLNTVHPLIPAMKERGYGQIAIMSSLAGYRGLPGSPAYCASKAAVKSYGEALRGYFVSDGIDVNVICPGFVRSRMTAVNDFPMPFLMDAEQAAQIIVKGLSRNKALIAFPWQMAILFKVILLLPNVIIDGISRRLPAKT